MVAGTQTPLMPPGGKLPAAEIAKLKLPDLNTDSLESAMQSVRGTARSMGLDVID